MARLGALIAKRTSFVSSAGKGIEGVLAEFKNYYVSAVAKEIEDERVREERLRVSSFPYCPLQHAYTRLTKHEKDKTAGFGSYYYTQVGTVTHDIIQDFAGRGGKIYGAWLCTKKKCDGTRAFSSKNKCPKCGARMRYEELTVKAFKNLSGHLDGVWKSESGEYFVVDYKTSSTTVLMSQKKNPTLPYHHNVCQIKAYCALLELCFDIKISGWILMYVARDNPMIWSKAVGEYISDKAKKRQLKKIKGYDRDWDRVVGLTSFSELMELVKEKPCSSHDDYLEKFDSIDPCPLSKGGICFNAKQLKSTLKIVWSDRPKELQ